MITDKTIYRFFVLLVFSIFFLDYFSIKLRLIPRIITWTPDLLSLVFMLLVLLYLAFSKKLYVDKKYLVILLIYLAHLIIGALLNSVSAGTLIAGIRTYIRYLPIFFLPIILNIKADVINRLLKLFLYLGFLQVPIAVYQRFFQFRGVQTGDVVTGTLNSPSIMAIYQLSVVCFLLTLYIKKQMPMLKCFILSLILFIPCTINETKAVIILFPAAVLTINFFSQSKESRLRRFIIVPSILALLIAIFIPIYDHFIQPKWGYGLIEFFQKEGRLEGYLYKGATGEEESKKEIGRIDSINLAIKHNSKDPLKLVFGLGMGNLTPSHISYLRGKYAHFAELGAHITMIGNLIWEVGIGGALIFVLLFVMSAKDALVLSNAKDVDGIIGTSWIGIIAMFTLSLFYKNLLHHNLGFLLWFFAGYVASAKYRYIKCKGEIV